MSQKLEGPQGKQAFGSDMLSGLRRYGKVFGARPRPAYQGISIY